MQSSGATKSGIAAIFLAFTASALGACAVARALTEARALGDAALVFTRASAASPRLDCQIASASALARPPLASMNGFGALPLPCEICCIDRPEATDLSC